MPASNQFYLVKGKTIDELLQNNEAAFFYLDGLVKAGVIDSYINIATWLPSSERQQENYHLYSKLYQSGYLDEFESIGILNRKEIDEINSSFNSSKEQTITIEDWLSSYQGNKLANLWLGKIDNKFASIISLQGINQLDKLNDINDEIEFVDKVSESSNMFYEYKVYALKLLIFAVIFIFAILSFRYSIKNALIIISAPVVAIASVFLVLAIMGISLGLFNTLALFLVLGIGLDYGIFFSESKTDKSEAFLAIIMSAATTLCSFGFLSLSDTPAIKDFGLTMLIGIISVFIVSLSAESFLSKNSEVFDGH
jgi:predicted exporter